MCNFIALLCVLNCALVVSVCVDKIGGGQLSFGNLRCSDFEGKSCGNDVDDCPYFTTTTNTDGSITTYTEVPNYSFLPQNGCLTDLQRTELMMNCQKTCKFCTGDCEDNPRYIDPVYDGDCASWAEATPDGEEIYSCATLGDTLDHSGYYTASMTPIQRLLLQLSCPQACLGGGNVIQPACETLTLDACQSLTADDKDGSNGDLAFFNENQLQCDANFVCSVVEEVWSSVENVDNVQYIDPNKEPCSNWVDYDCINREFSASWTAYDKAALLANCPNACDLMCIDGGGQPFVRTGRSPASTMALSRLLAANVLLLFGFLVF